MHYLSGSKRNFQQAYPKAIAVGLGKSSVNHYKLGIMFLLYAAMLFLAFSH